MITVAYIGFGVSVREYHIPYVENRSDIKVKYVYRREEDIAAFAEYEPHYPEIIFTTDLNQVLTDEEVNLVVVNTPDQFHVPYAKQILNAGKHALVEKPFARSRYECDELIAIAEQKGLVLAVFQQTFYAPFYGFAYDLMKSGKLGDIKQISIRYNGFSRRWDWQTLQKKCAGSTYNTGPHPIGMALGFLDFDRNTRVVYSKLDTALTSGDADDYAKILLTAPEKPLVDIEMSSIDAYAGYNIKLQGSKGTMKATPTSYEMTYIADGENPDRPVQESFLQDEQGNPLYCWENLVKRVESGSFNGTAFDVGTAGLYKELYDRITEGEPMTVTAEMAAAIISVAETVHAENPLPVQFL
jgi:predicted dehydrogenase